MRLQRDSHLTRFVLISFFVVAALYALFEIRGQILGPSIALRSLPVLTNNPFVHVRGQAVRITSLSMDGGQISVTQDGSFDQPYLLAPGYNRIVLDAKDSYGHTEERVIEITYDAPASFAATGGSASSSSFASDSQAAAAALSGTLSATSSTSSEKTAARGAFGSTSAPR